MTTTVASVGPFREVHDIDITTQKGRRFKIDICKKDGGFDSSVTVLDRVSSNPGSWVYETKPASPSANDNFSAAVDLIKDYLSRSDPNDTIQDVHNPCNTPFLSEEDQNMLTSQQGISVNARVN